MARTQAADYDERKQEIVETAAAMFAERGFNGASVADANNFFMIDELQISNSRIGPPAGFNNVTRPSPVTGVSTQ